MRSILLLVVGIVIGAALAVGGYFLILGSPAASTPAPGQPIAAPDANNPAPGTAIIALPEPFFNTLLGSIFTDLNAPAFPLAAPSANCPNTLTILPDGNNVQTAVRFVDNRVTAPLAFRGSYNAPLIGCQNFSGTAQANVDLRFDAGDQTLYGMLNVVRIDLANMIPGAAGFVTPIVQNSLNERVNPIKILDGRQLNLAVPVAPAGGTLSARVTDIRADITDSLRLHVTYDFDGRK